MERAFDGLGGVRKRKSLLGSPSEGGEFRIITPQKPQSDKSLLMCLGVKEKQNKMFWKPDEKKLNLKALTPSFFREAR